MTENILSILKLLLSLVFRNQAAIIAENIALRHQINVLKRNVKQPKINRIDRLLWIWFSRIWNGWKTALFIVKPETVIKWHRKGFKLFWRLKSKRKPGRPVIDYEIILLIRRMSRENKTWGAPRIKSELMLLGHNVSESTVAKYMVKGNKDSSQTWRTFLRNHMHNTVAVDFFTIPTFTYSIIYVFIILRHSDRKLLHFNVTEHPTVQWRRPSKNGGNFRSVPPNIIILLTQLLID